VPRAFGRFRENLLAGSVGMTLSEKAPATVRGRYIRQIHGKVRPSAWACPSLRQDKLKRRLNNGDQKASEPATVGGRYVNRATAKMARLTCLR
jgi:hypothetical protein